jgi:hypothetical protein
MDEFEITFGFDFGWKLKCVVAKLPNQINFQTTLWNIGTEKIHRIFKNWTFLEFGIVLNMKYLKIKESPKKVWALAILMVLLLCIYNIV